MTKIKKRRVSITPPYLIVLIRDAVDDGVIKEPFTPRDIDNWIINNNIRKPDGSTYSRGYANTLLSQSYIRTRNKTNTNWKCLDRRKNDKGRFEYWFD